MNYTDKQFAEWGRRGGKTAAANMTPAQRKARAKKARKARKPIPKRNGK